LTIDQLVYVLTDVKNSFIQQYKYIFSIDNITLNFTDEAIREIAQKCIDLKTGARGLQTELEKILLPHMFHIQKYKENGIEEINIDVDLVKEPVALI
jgi:ATP-dependent Clp protease ATP-binding subunit ClpX